MTHKIIVNSKILIVDDQPANLSILFEYLDSLGADVMILQEGQEVIKIAETKKPDIILLDIIMPDISGFEVCKRLKKHPKTTDIPVIFMSVINDTDSIVKGFECGGVDYIIKPIRIEEVIMRISTHLKICRAEELLAQIAEKRTYELRESNKQLELALNKHRQAEENLRSTQQAVIRASHLSSLGELAAGIAHEINTPINNVINYAHLVINTIKDSNSEESEFAKEIINESNRIARIVKNLLSFASGGGKERFPVRINDILHDTISLVGKQINKEGITFNVNIKEELPYIMAHPVDLQGVFMNILSNARFALNKKYPSMKHNKIIDISAEDRAEGYIQVIFLDNGCGIPSDIIDKVMEPFFTTKPIGTGTGLGLSISYGIIHSHGGFISIDSVEGEYTKVIINLPVWEVEDERSAHSIS